MTFLLLALLAATPEDVAEARKHYEAGRALYSVDRFKEAAAEFEAGYALAPRPLFVFNAAQALRRFAEVSHDRSVMLKAQSRYREYVTIAPAQDPERAQSQAKLASIEQWLEENPEPAVEAPRLAEPAPEVVAPASATTPRPEPTVVVEKRGFLAEHPWVIAIIGAVAVGAAVGIGIGVTRAQGGCASASIGCIDAR